MVHVEAVGINFADTLATRGVYHGTPPPPFITGREFAGVVEATGERVMGYMQWGAAAEKIAVDPELLWPQPAGWTSVQSAAFPGQLPDCLSGLLEGRRHRRRDRADSVDKIIIGAAC